jgi:SAM-dependent methyltransferase
MKPPERDPTARFSERVDAYVRYRPDYPARLVPLLAERFALAPGAPVADVGAGTGIFTAHLLRHGHTVYAVEPNAPMRAAAEARLGGEAGFRSVAGSAEATGLASGSVDLVTAAQAFHWFERATARAEFGRILRPAGGWVALVWNDRRSAGAGFQREYEELLLRHGTDYQTVDHRQVDAGALARFFGPEAFFEEALYNEQRLDLDGLRGRLLSSSYVPGPGEPGCERMLEDLARLFERYAEGGRVTVEYDTRVYGGRLGPRLR